MSDRSTTRALRIAFRTAELLAPGPASRAAYSLLLRVPPQSGPSALPCDGQAFEVTSQHGTVRGVQWGCGPVVYLVHGWGGRGDQLAGFVRPLVATGHRVVMFDAPSHGASDPGPSGPGRTHGVEFGHALDAVSARFGPARAVVAHSMASVSTMLTLRDGWLSAERLVLLAPMSNLASDLDRFGRQIGLGRRARRGLDREIERRTGYRVAEFDMAGIAANLEVVPPILVVHDRRDREMPYQASVAVVDAWPEAVLKSTDGLGHRRIVRDAEVVDSVVRFVAAAQMCSETSTALVSGSNALKTCALSPG